MKIKAVLQKVLVAMHRGRPSDPRDCRSWHRAVTAAEKAVATEPSIDDDLEFAQMVREIIDDNGSAELTICARSANSQPSHCIVYHEWQGPQHWNQEIEARANSLIDCLRIINTRRNQRDRSKETRTTPEPSGPER